MSQQQQPIRYGDVFNVQGDLGEKPVAPADASMMQTAETMVLGKTEKGAAASAMQSAAAKNERAGFVAHNQVTDISAGEQGVAISETNLPGRRIITESIGDQVVGKYSSAAPLLPPAVSEEGEDGITIGEALEAAALAAGGKAVDWSDAAAVQAAEVRATGRTTMAAGGVSAAAQSAATLNARTNRSEDKIKLADVLTVRINILSVVLLSFHKDS